MKHFVLHLYHSRIVNNSDHIRDHNNTM